MERLPKIVQQRLQGNLKPGVHPDPDLLAAFAENALNDRERFQVLQHVAECADCREVLSLAMPAIEPAQSPAPETSSWVSGPMLRWPILRWGALAACVVVVGTAVTLHYEWRQGVRPSVAEKSLPAAPGAVASSEPREEAAAKNAPHHSFEDRDLGVVSDKLVNQNKKALVTGMIATRAAEAAPPRLVLPGLDQKGKAPEFAGDRLAKTAAASSAGQLAPPVSELGTAVPAPLPYAKVGVERAAADSESKLRNDTAGRSVGSLTNMETIEGGRASATEMAQSARQKAKNESSKDEPQKEIQALSGQAVGGASKDGGKVDTLSAAVAQTAPGDFAKRTRAGQNQLRWTLSADGLPQRSFDSGKSWETIPVAGKIVFRALAANDSDIWVGGAAGALYHSSDAGQHWSRVIPLADGQPLTADIVGVEFSDAAHGKVMTGNRETWTTSNAGESWQRH